MRVINNYTKEYIKTEKSINLSGLYKIFDILSSQHGDRINGYTIISNRDKIESYRRFFLGETEHSIVYKNDTNNRIFPEFNKFYIEEIGNIKLIIKEDV